MFTAVGLIRQSIGPAISVSDRGSHGCFCAAITAVANGGVIEMDDDIASRWGPRIVEYVQAVSDALAKVPAEA